MKQKPRRDRRMCPARALLRDVQWYLDAQAVALPDLAALAAGQRGVSAVAHLCEQALAAERFTPGLARRLSQVADLLSGLDEPDHVVDPTDARIDDVCLAADRLRSLAERCTEALDGARSIQTTCPSELQSEARRPAA